MATKRKRNSITIEQKVKIINHCESNANQKKTDVAAHFDIPKQTLNDILNKKDKIVSEYNKKKSQPLASQRKRLRVTNYDDVDAALILWFRQYYNKPNLRVDGEMLYQKAKYFAEAFNHETSPSSSWIDRFKKRWNIGKILKLGESGGVDTDVVNNWRETAMKDILERYEPRNIFNCDETGLFYQLLPENSLAFVGEKLKGNKQSKVRVTVLVGSNMDGSEKMPLFVIGKSKNPRALKNVKIPVRYTANKKAWMRSDIFESEMRRFDGQMKLQNRKIAMLVDNCPAHPLLEDLQNIELIFLPPNTTSVVQPMDSGIIKNLKFFYRRILAGRRLEAAESNSAFNWSILDCLIALKSSWSMVKQSTIANCWKNAGFVVQQAVADVTEPSPNITENDEQEQNIFRSIWERLSDHFGDRLSGLENYISVDTSAESVEEMSLSEIVEHVRDSLQEDASEDVDTEGNADSVESRIQIPDSQQVHSALNVLRRFSCGVNLNSKLQDQILTVATQVENFLIMQKSRNTKQLTLADCFNRNI